MTNEEYIKSLPRKELAAVLINVTEVPDYIDYDGRVPLFYTAYVTSDRMEFFDDYEGALEHECWWLAQEKEDEED